MIDFIHFATHFISPWAPLTGRPQDSPPSPSPRASVNYAPGCVILMTSAVSPKTNASELTRSEILRILLRVD